MLEWMHDKDVVEYMKADFTRKTMNDCISFIEKAVQSSENMHLAIVDDEDEYMGTVSLKNIDYVNKNAEFGITVRKKAMGNGFSQFGMESILKKGINELGLNQIIWCVNKENLRANKFYLKSGYKRIDSVPESYKKIYCDWQKMNWYEYSSEGVRG